MEINLIAKVKNIIAKKECVEENDIRSFMILARKLLDKMSQADQNSYLILRLFCNWTAHIKITESNTGLRVLAEINDTLVKVRNFTDNTAIQKNITQALGFSILRKELRLFLHQFKIEDVFAHNNIWSIFIDCLVEIIRDVPISFPQLSKLDSTKQKIYNKIVQNPIKPGAGVISITISLVGSIICMLIRTEDTYTFIVPLLDN